MGCGQSSQAAIGSAGKQGYHSLAANRLSTPTGQPSNQLIEKASKEQKIITKENPEDQTEINNFEPVKKTIIQPKNIGVSNQEAEQIKDMTQLIQLLKLQINQNSTPITINGKNFVLNIDDKEIDQLIPSKQKSVSNDGENEAQKNKIIVDKLPNMSNVTIKNKHQSQTFVNNLLNIPAEEKANSESNQSSANSTGENSKVSQPNKKRAKPKLKLNLKPKVHADQQTKYTVLNPNSNSQQSPKTQEGAQTKLDEQKIKQNLTKALDDLASADQNMEVIKEQVKDQQLTKSNKSLSNMQFLKPDKQIIKNNLSPSKVQLFDRLFKELEPQNQDFKDLQLTKCNSLGTIRNSSQCMASLDEPIKTMIRKPFQSLQQDLKDYENMSSNENTPIASQGRYQRKSLGSQTDKNRVDLVFLHASPNIVKYTDQVTNAKITQTSETLNFIQEEDNIKKALKLSCQRVKFESKVATLENFEETLRKRPKILHISCHGKHIEERGNKNRGMGLRMLDNNDQWMESHFLIFENEYGSGNLISAKQLRDIMKLYAHQIEVIVVAACDSQGVGEILQMCGAKHVVCVEQTKTILDEVAIKFTRIFYSLLFEGDINVCKAFEQAQKVVGGLTNLQEARILKMLNEKQSQKSNVFGKPPKDHRCSCLPAIEPGKWECISDHNRVKQIPAKLDSLKFREKEMTTLLENLLLYNMRIIQLLGLRGIGKSSLARNTLHYVKERKIFTGGIFNIQVKNVRTNIDMLALIRRTIMRFLDLNQEEKQQLIDRHCSQQRMIDFFIAFFKGEYQAFLRKTKNKHFASDKSTDQKFLLCLDNAEEIILNENSEFKQFLYDLYEYCPNLYIIVTSSKNIGPLPNDLPPTTQFLHSLKAELAVEIFLDNCGEHFDDDFDELYEFLLVDTNYPFHKFIADKNQTVESIANLTEQVKKEKMRRQFTTSDYFVKLREVLANHDLFKQLSGNPTSIKMIAASLQNPLIKQNNLIDMYLGIKKEKDLVFEEQDAYENGQQKTQKSKPDSKRNYFSLQLSTEMSINLLQNTYPEDIDLLYFLGCLPGGVKEQQLKNMWQKDISTKLANLMNFSFLEVGVEKYVLTPHMITYIETNIPQFNKQEFMGVICNFYKELLQKIFLNIGTQQSTVDRQDSLQHQFSSLPSINFQSSIDEFPFNNLNRNKAIEQEGVGFEELASELRNIDNCLNFLIKNEQQTLSEKQRWSLATGSNSGSSSAFNLQVIREVDDSPKTPSQIINKNLPHGETAGANLLSTSNVTTGSGQQTNNSNDMQEPQSKISPRSASGVSVSGMSVSRISQKNVSTVADIKGRRSSKQSNDFEDMMKEVQKTLHNKVSHKSSKPMHAIDEHHGESDSMSEDDAMISSSSDDADKTDPDYFNSNNQTEEEKVPALIGTIESEVLIREDSYDNFLKQANKEESKIAYTHKNTLKMQQMLHISSNLVLQNRRSEDQVRQNNYYKQKTLVSQNQLKGKIKLGRGERNLSEDSEDAESYEQFNDDQSESLSSGDSERVLTNPELLDEDSRQSSQTNIIEDVFGFDPRKSEGKTANVIDHLKTNSQLKHQDTFNQKKETRESQQIKELEDADQFDQQMRFSRQSTQFRVKPQLPKKKTKKIAALQKASTVDNVTFHNSTLKKMSTEGEFIILLAAVSFLANDYQYSLKISSTDFSQQTNDALFEGNLLRYRAMASIKLFEHARIVNVDHRQNFNLLTQAIDSLVNAQEIYEAQNDTRTLEKNFYGLAIVKYTLGYVHHKFFELLCDNTATISAQYGSFLFHNQQECLEQAARHYRDAFNDFQRVKHLLGKYLSKKNEIEVESMITDGNNDERLQRDRDTLQQLQSQFQSFQQQETKSNNGIQSNAYVIREHGEDISLMTEVVKGRDFHSGGGIDPRRTISVPESQSIQAVISEVISKNQ